MRNNISTAPYAPGNTASRLAAEEIEHKLDGVRAKVFEAIVRRGRAGATGSEIAAATGVTLLTVRPRCTDLSQAGFIRDSGDMRKNDDDKNETVWVSCAVWPKEDWKTLSSRSGAAPSGLSIFDEIISNLVVRSFFTDEQIAVIRSDLKSIGGEI